MTQSEQQKILDQLEMHSVTIVFIEERRKKENRELTLEELGRLCFTKRQIMKLLKYAISNIKKENENGN